MAFLGMLVCMGASARTDVVTDYGIIASGPPGVSTTRDSAREAAHYRTGGYLNDNVIEVQPGAGRVAFTDGSGTRTSRAALGLTLDTHLTAMLAPRYGQYFFGPQTGVIASALAGGNGTLAWIPAQLKVGYAFLPRLRVSARGGVNLVYRSVGDAVDLGPSSARLGGGAGWQSLWATGVDGEVSLTEGISLLLRPDVTFAPGGHDLVSATVGLEVGLG